MKHPVAYQPNSFLRLSLFLLFLVLPCNTLAGEPTNLRGKAFTLPSSQSKMSDQWQQKGIQYDRWAEKAELAVTLDQHLYPALLPIIKAFALKKRVIIKVHEGTCGISAGLLSRKQVDVGGFCCPPSATDRLPGLKFHTLGISALAVLIHPDNPVTNLSLKQTRQIFQGKLFNWSELKIADGRQGASRVIRPIGRLHCKQRPGHWRLILDKDDLFSPRLKEVGTIRDMIFHVAMDKGSIGYEVLWNIERYKEEGLAKYVTIDKADPTSSEEVVSLRYPFYRTYNITTWTPENLSNPLAEELVLHLIDQVENINGVYGIIPTSLLKKAGWKFKGNELIGEPNE